jgi:rubrerythrin
MKEFDSFEELLDYAIEREEQAYEFYTDMAEKMNDPEICKVFNDFAIDEMMHKQKLRAVKNGTFTISPEEVGSLGIAEETKTVMPTADMSYLETLSFAMKKEMDAFRLYSHMAKTMQRAELAEIFELLAQEEAKHKLHFEIEYDLRSF